MTIRPEKKEEEKNDNEFKIREMKCQERWPACETYYAAPDSFMFMHLDREVS